MWRGIKGRCGAFLLHCNGMAEERKEMVRLMNEIMEEWQEMEVNEKTR